MISPFEDTSPLERQARELAEVACDWSAQQTCGKSPRWEDLGEFEKAILTNQALTHIAFSEALKKVRVAEVLT